jgi:hypothetical protein
MKTQNTSRNGRVESHLSRNATAIEREETTMRSARFCTMAACMLVIGWLSTTPALGYVCETKWPGMWWDPQVWCIEGIDDPSSDIPMIPGPDDDVIVNHALVMDDEPVYVRSLTIGAEGWISSIGSDLEIWTTGGIDIAAGGCIESHSDPDTGTGGALTLISGELITIRTLGQSPAILADRQITLEGRGGIDLISVSGPCVFSQTGPVVLQAPTTESVLLAEDIELVDIIEPEPTIAEVLVIDDFETYTDDWPNRVFDVWIDGWENPSNGSVVGNLISPFAEQEIVYSGRQSMPFSYNNTEGVTESVAYRIFQDPEDWSHYDVLSLWIHGDPNNIVTEADRFFVRIEDVVGKSGAIVHGDPNVLTSNGWHKLEVNLHECIPSQVELDSVRTLSLGIAIGNDPQTGGNGTILMDDVCVSKAHIDLQLPGNGEHVQQTDVLFKWEPFGLQDALYTLTIWKLPNLAEPLTGVQRLSEQDLVGVEPYAVFGDVRGTSYRYADDGTHPLLWGGSYAYSVEAMCGDQAIRSEIRHFNLTVMWVTWTNCQMTISLPEQFGIVPQTISATGSNTFSFRPTDDPFQPDFSLRTFYLYSAGSLTLPVDVQGTGTLKPVQIKNLIITTDDVDTEHSTGTIDLRSGKFLLRYDITRVHVWTEEYDYVPVDLQVAIDDTGTFDFGQSVYFCGEGTGRNGGGMGAKGMVFLIKKRADVSDGEVWSICKKIAAVLMGWPLQYKGVSGFWHEIDLGVIYDDADGMDPWYDPEHWGIPEEDRDGGKIENAKLRKFKALVDELRNAWENCEKDYDEFQKRVKELLEDATPSMRIAVIGVLKAHGLPCDFLRPGELAGEEWETTWSTLVELGISVAQIGAGTTRVGSVINIVYGMVTTTAGMTPDMCELYGLMKELLKAEEDAARMSAAQAVVRQLEKMAGAGIHICTVSPGINGLVEAVRTLQANSEATKAAITALDKAKETLSSK